jgi:hypothetical protein
MGYSDEEFQEMRKARVRGEKEAMLREEGPVPDMAYLAGYVGTAEKIEATIESLNKQTAEINTQIADLMKQLSKIRHSISPHIVALAEKFALHEGE